MTTRHLVYVTTENIKAASIDPVALGFPEPLERGYFLQAESHPVSDRVLVVNDGRFSWLILKERCEVLT